MAPKQPDRQLVGPFRDQYGARVWVIWTVAAIAGLAVAEGVTLLILWAAGYL